MTPIQSATAAEPQTSSNNLRIMEASGSRPRPSRRPSRKPHADTLHRAFAFLRSGWKWLEQKRTQQLTSRRLRVAETISLGEKRSVAIVQVDGAQYLIGSSPSSVQLLAVLDRVEAPLAAGATEERQS